MRDLGQILTFPVIPLVGSLAFLMGCAGDQDGLKKHVKSLETQVTSLRADADRLEERLEAVELSGALAQRASRESAVAAEPAERPRLKVIRLSPDEEAVPEEALPAPPRPASSESEGARPVIRGQGDRVIKTGDAGGTSRAQASGLSLALVPKGTASED